MTLECVSRNSTRSGLLWFDVTPCVAYSANCDAREQIYSGFALADNAPSGFDVTEVNNATHVTRNLNIDSTQLSDAGVYLCNEQQPGVFSADSSSGQLIVLGNCICLLTAS